MYKVNKERLKSRLKVATFILFEMSLFCGRACTCNVLAELLRFKRHLHVKKNKKAAEACAQLPD